MSNLGNDARHYLREKNDTELERQLKNLDLEKQRIKSVGRELKSDDDAVKKVLDRIEAKSKLLTKENERRNSFYSF